MLQSSVARSLGSSQTRPPGAEEGGQVGGRVAGVQQCIFVPCAEVVHASRSQRRPSPPLLPKVGVGSGDAPGSKFGDQKKRLVPRKVEAWLNRTRAFLGDPLGIKPLPAERAAG